MSGAALLLLISIWLPVVGAFSDAEGQHAQASEKEITLLTARIANSLASQERLIAENKQLQREIEGWESVGTKVMNREARIVNAITQAKGSSASTDQTSMRTAVSAGLSKQPLTLSETKAAELLPPAVVSWQLFVLAITVVLTVAFCWFRAPLSTLLSKERLVELSELQLQGVPAGFGEAYLVVMQPSDGLRSRTRAAVQGQGSYVLKFNNEILKFPVRKGNGPCTISIFRRGELEDEKIGAALLNASAILDALENGSQYLHFPVQPTALSQGQELQIAMRICETSNGTSRTKGEARLKRAGDVV